jgi:lipopolysaccharide export system protein LptA
MPPARKAGALLAALWLALAAQTAAALPDDRQQAIEIQSREAIREEAKGLTIYSGDVVIKQGTIEIAADKVTVETQNNTVVRIVCVGKPARYQQQPESDKALVVAQGNTIRYDLETDIVLLLENASLIQEEATLTGERIEYDLKQAVIRAKGGSESGKERIRMVIPPSQQPEAN